MSVKCQDQRPDWSGLWREWEVRKWDDCDQLYQELGCKGSERYNNNR